jgi:rhodanese-related sulfurtransferase
MKLQNTLVLFAALGVIAFVIYYTFSSPYKITSEKAKRLLSEGKIDLVLDVRTKMEYDLGHYPEALHIPTATLSEQVETMIPEKETSILIYCNTGQRSRWATDVLKKKGYKNVLYITEPYWSLLR